MSETGNIGTLITDQAAEIARLKAEVERLKGYQARRDARIAELDAMLTEARLDWNKAEAERDEAYTCARMAEERVARLVPSIEEARAEAGRMREIVSQARAWLMKSSHLTSVGVSNCLQILEERDDTHARP